MTIAGKIAVTGGGGFIGKALVRAMVQQDCQVVVIGRHPYPDLQAMGVECRQGDIRDRRFLETAFAGCRTVFHVAAKAGIWGSRDEYFAINTGGTQNVLAACRTNGVRHLVYTSTPSVVFDRSDISGADESLPYASTTLCHYAASKIAAERMLLGASDGQLHTVAIRPHLVWGPGDQHLIPRLLQRGRAGQLNIVGNGQNLVDIAYVENVVHAHLLAAENLQTTATAAGQAFFIGQRQPVRLWEWINALFAQMGIAPVTRRIPFPLAYVVGTLLEVQATVRRQQNEPRMTRFLAHQLAQSHWFCHQKAEQVLGYREQVSTEAGMEQLVAWLRGKDGLFRQ